MRKIDTHMHLLYPDRFSYPWVDEVPPLQGAFPLEDYKKASEGCGIAGSVFMEVDVAPEQSVDEARFFCGLVEDPASDLIGVIAAARPEARGFEELLDAMACPRLKGIRRVLHTQPDELSQQSLFRGNLRLLTRYGLPFDLCVLARQLPIAIELADACPEVSFVLDHCGVPDIAGGAFQSWSVGIGHLAKRENVFCKISGLPTYCGPGETGADVLRPWIEYAIGCFGWERVVWGSDWPVCTLNGTLKDWVGVLESILADESEPHRTALYSGNARRVYALE